MLSNTPQILIADDEEGLRFVLRQLVEEIGYNAIEAEDGPSALDILRNKRVDLAILDIKMPGMSGIDVLRQALIDLPNLVAVVITAYGSRELAIEALQAGAYDYFTKPFELDEMRITIQRAVEKRELLAQVHQLQSQLDGRDSFPEIIGSSDRMKQVYRLMERVSDNDVPVLVTGESGTGKELVAKAIHAAGPRRDGPLVRVNCAAIPENLLESELFGHERGAFTGAVASHAGKFEQAQGGTIFLDEIGEMPLALQSKILRVLQEREVERVGGKKTIPCDARVITATNKDLGAEVAEKRFREDLYFRVNVISIEMPPLRERITDIPHLTRHFIKKHRFQLGKNIRELTPRALDLLLQYSWPGNVRELENVIQRAMILAVGTEIEPNDLPPHLLPERQGDGFSAPFERRTDLETPMAVQIRRMVESLERHLIAQALRNTESRQEAADLLGISRKSLHNKMCRYDLMGKD